MREISSLLILTVAFFGFGSTSEANGGKDIYSFSAYDIEGKNIDFEIYR